MKKTIIGAMILICGLGASTIEWDKNIPKNYKVSNTYQGDFNSDGVEDILLNLFSIDKEKEKVIILKGEKNNKYTIILDSNNILKYPNNNGQGYMIQDISVNFLKENIIVSTSEYQGLNLNRTFYFKYEKHNFYLYKYIESYGTNCNNYTIGKIRINDNIQSIIKLKDFSIMLFFKNYYSSRKFQNNLRREVLDNFENNYLKALKAFRKKESKALKDIVNKMLVYKDNEKTCQPHKYLNMYLYLNQKNTITKSNDIAFFFDQAGYHKEAIYLLEKILEKYPNRTVAHYNLADAYWALGEKKKAIASYKTYIEQMKTNGKEKRIPKVVKDRVASK